MRSVFLLLYCCVSKLEIDKSFCGWRFDMLAFHGPTSASVVRPRMKQDSAECRPAVCEGAKMSGSDGGAEGHACRDCAGGRGARDGGVDRQARVWHGAGLWRALLKLPHPVPGHLNVSDGI